MESMVKEQARFNARLPKEQKILFEKAASLGGYRNLTDFIILAVQEKAKEIINEKERIISSEKDSEIFFNAITETSQPNQALKNALQDYDHLTSNKI